MHTRAATYLYAHQTAYATTANIVVSLTSIQYTEPEIQLVG